MTRAYIVLARNDLEDSLLQVLDLKPNATPSKGLRVYEGVAQGGYQTFYLLDAVNLAITTVAGAGGGASLDSPATNSYGLSAYLLDHVEDTGGNESLTAAEAVTISGLIETDVAAGVAINLARINVHINTPAGVAGSDLDGTLGNSTGTVEEILRMLQGERWRLPASSQVRTNPGLFDAVVRGAFVTAPVIEMDDSVRTTRTWREGAVVNVDTAGPVRGRKSTAPMTHIRPGEPRTAPVQAGLQDTNFQDVRSIVETGHLHLSATDGVLAELLSATYSYLNPAFTYAGGATPAQTIGAVNIPATGIARAVVVYDVLGNVI
jgi:hypothetical protein